METIEVVEIPGYEGGGCTVDSGTSFRIIDVEGCQIADLFVLSKSDPTEFFSPARTRNVISRLVPRVGDPLHSSRNRLMMTFREDTSPGAHDMAFAPCDDDFYATLGAVVPHPNCQHNFFEAVQHLGLACDMLPDPFNLFQNTRPDASGHYVVGRSLSEPGDYVEFRAEMDLIVVVTACSVDVPINGVEPIGARSTPVRIEVLR